MVLVFGLGSWPAVGDEPAIPAKAAFAKLKELAGEWKGTGQHGVETIVYKVTANGSALTETLFPGTSHEMVTVYHMDGSDLRLTHYCASGNQPRLKLDKAASKPNLLVFDFEGGTNLDPSTDLHMHASRVMFLDGGKIETQWDAYAQGKKLETKKLVLDRAR